MRAALSIFAIVIAAIFAAAPLRAEELTALARFDPAASRIANEDNGIAVDLAISQAVPYRVFLLDGPPRLVMDFSEVDFGAGKPKAVERAAGVTDLGWGAIRPGWSRLVAALDGPYRVVSAEERVAAEGAAGGTAVIRVRLQPVDAETFAKLAAAPVSSEARWSLPKAAPVAAPKRRQTGAAPLTVVLDPGHGGIDPGAEAGGKVAATLMLSFARELAEVLRRAGMRVTLTRDDDVFVPLETRISIARAAGADVFLSLHADALAEGEATGATVYELADTATDAASARLAERHDRADLLAGIDLTGQDDLIASVMMDLARSETQPRADRLALSLVKAIRTRGGKMHRHPIQGAAFSVLKSADIPSLLLELGFLSSPSDRVRLADPVWRSMMQEAILAALTDWAVADAAEAKLIRQ
jgi:N-acetylmuramoyl-L-alanine amidase